MPGRPASRRACRPEQVPRSPSPDSRSGRGSGSGRHLGRRARDGRRGRGGRRGVRWDDRFGRGGDDVGRRSRLDRFGGCRGGRCRLDHGGFTRHGLAGWRARPSALRSAGAATALVAGAFFAGAFLAGFFSGLTSSGCSGRVSPSRSGAPRHHVGVGLGKRRRRTLRGNAERRTEVEDLCVRHPELFRELMDPDLLSCHVSDSTFHSRHSLVDARITGCAGGASGGRLNGVRHPVLLVSPVRLPAAASCARPVRTRCGAAHRRDTATRPRSLRPRTGTATRRARRSPRRLPRDQPRG